MVKFVGRDNCVATSINRINQNVRFETKNWFKKLLITMSEVNSVDQLKNSSIINQATGEDPIPAEYKGSNKDFSFVNYGKFIYPTNKLLKVDEGDGFGRRVRKIDFINRFEKERDVIEEIPNSEFENLARKSLRIAKELWKNRQFTGDVNISERMRLYQEASKTELEKFIDQNCDITDSYAYTSFDDFYAKFVKKFKGDGKTIPSKIKISKELRDLGWEVKVKGYPNEQKNLTNNEEKGWTTKQSVIGIKLKKEENL